LAADERSHVGLTSEGLGILMTRSLDAWSPIPQTIHLDRKLRMNLRGSDVTSSARDERIRPGREARAVLLAGAVNLLLTLHDRRARLLSSLGLLLAWALLPACDPGYDQGTSSSSHWTGASGTSSGASSGGGDGNGGAGKGQDPAPPPTDDAGPVGTPTPPTPDLTAAQCGTCHTTIYQQWTNSMHSHALTSPTVIVQTNQDLALPLSKAPSPDPQKFCINCHGPTFAASATSPEMPPSVPHWKEGITCTSCHQFDGTPQKGSGGFAGNDYGPAFQKGVVQGKEMLGAVDSPVANSMHTSNSTGQDFSPNPNQLCANCHEVWIDYDHDGIVEKGLDLALQTTWDEYKEYKTLGGQESCVSCHMPVVAGLTRIADGAAIPSQQSVQAPPRQVHDHSFVGVDFALDTPAQGQATLAARTALMQKAATFFIDRDSVGNSGDGVGFNVFLANSGTGHDLPSGFAFARQMWIEITATDSTGSTVFSSGLLGQPTDDLCDGEILFDRDNPMNRFLQNCDQVDDELVTLQQKLVDLAGFQADGSDPFDPAGLTKAVEIGEETWMQFLHGGVVARQRPFDGTQLVNLKPFEQEEFHYDIPTGNTSGGLHVQARLLFRQLPPYFLRALASGQAATDVPQISPLISNLETLVMATDELDL
jgi:hypothetical protein